MSARPDVTLTQLLFARAIASLRREARTRGSQSLLGAWHISSIPDRIGDAPSCSSEQQEEQRNEEVMVLTTVVQPRSALSS